jgi:N-acetylmuramoyl-L-alanine amidase
MSLLRKGSRGPEVRDLQTQLNRLGAKLVVDGDFGSATDRAVRSFQTAQGLVSDGIVGKQTATVIARLLSPQRAGQTEPDKSAMSQVLPRTASPSGDVSKPPVGSANIAFLPTSRPLDEIIVHCAATPEGRDYTVADIRAWHRQRGFSDVGYHYVVYRDGRVVEGRPVGQVGAHCADHGKNRGTIGICYIGGVAADGKTAKDTRTPEQRSSLLWLCEQLVRRHPTIVRITGHNQYAAKACPSFDVRLDALSTVVKRRAA